MHTNSVTYSQNIVRTRYLYTFNGQEKVEELGISHTTATFWEYDARLGRRWNIDPKPNPSVSSYACFNNNPIWFTDILGDTATKEEAAAMTAHVYGDKKDGILIGGWELSENKYGIELDNKKTGFKSAIYQRQTGTDENGNAVFEYAYVTAGTDGASAKDWGNNLLQVVGLSKQYKQSMNNAVEINKQLGSNKELSFIGHSLGGGAAAANAYKTGRNAITFNAAGVSPLTVKRNNTSLIDAYILKSDPLNLIQNSKANPIGVLMPDVDGTRHYLIPKDAPAIYNGHSINSILGVFGINSEIYDK